ncbi:CPBP family intramembrane glutamic endopeptidase [Clostridium sp. MB40-C1]|uniref:CPBP family intramembrane glutamic endopeptidase n=1 Tax=Clostridium sp. MB40-C1 TaxID=3070996 RepID=UPI0027E2056B|nr:CPBP family intramembrane glutamic endopeptidase [Clostridium sp. MB40-C1]WMJ82176.1 CPBP family intramembrane glutamic endopeptidase [Clostridium sp. MB40-C1]
MNLVKAIESGKIRVYKIGILKAVLIIIISIFIEVFGMSFYQFVRNGKTLAYGNLIVGILLKYFSIVVILKLFAQKFSEGSGHKKIKVRYFIITIFIIIGFRLFYEYSIGSFVNKLDVNPIVEKAFEELASTPLIFFISVCIVAPIFEEILFRGIILNGMAKALNEKLAIIISSFLFALIHMNLVQGINAFLLGLILGIIYLSTKSIYLSIFAHLINNTLGIFVSTYMENLKLANYFSFQCIVTFSGVIIMILGFLILNKRTNIED